MFTPEQIAALAAPLSRDHVKTRQQAGRNVSYLEGWQVIAEANRIFGFDGWDRETIDLCCISEKPCEIGQGKKPGFRVAYICKSRIVVYAGDRRIIREGTGYGSGIDVDVGEAHESAAKEAETDCMKRGLMTFGNPFGLALYDKAQSEVEPIGARRPAPTPAPAQAPQQAAPTPRAVHPEEPPQIAEGREEFVRQFWKREWYGLDPEVVDGGMPRWDYWRLLLARAAPNLDAFNELTDDNREFHKRWYRAVSPAVSAKLVNELRAIDARFAPTSAAAE